MFHMYDKKIISVTLHALDPLPLLQTVTLSRTPSPSSVTYFMNGPLWRLWKGYKICFLRKLNLAFNLI